MLYNIYLVKRIKYGTRMSRLAIILLPFYSPHIYIFFGLFGGLLKRHLTWAGIAAIHCIWLQWNSFDTGCP
jgi:hypothetical protein